MVTQMGKGVALGATLTAVAIGSAGAALADEPGFYGFYGTAAEYPVGMCIDVTNNIEIDANQLKNNIPVPCSDDRRDMRVVQHATSWRNCHEPVWDAIPTTDGGVVLCVVQDYNGM
jgi:hypothetical protein